MTMGNELALLTRCVTRPVPLPAPKANGPLAPTPFDPPLPVPAEVAVAGDPTAFARLGAKANTGLLKELRAVPAKPTRGADPLPKAAVAAARAGNSFVCVPIFSLPVSFAGVFAGAGVELPAAEAVAAAAAAATACDRNLVVLVLGIGGGSISVVCLSCF